MIHDFKKLTVALAPNMEARLQEVQEGHFGQNICNKMLKDLIVLGLASLRFHKTEKRKRMQ